MWWFGKVSNFITPKGWFCIATLTTIGLLFGVNTYCNKNSKRLSKANIELNLQIEQLKQDYDTCQNTIKAINDYEIENSKQQTNFKKRINRVKNIKSDYVDFNSIW